MKEKILYVVAYVCLLMVFFIVALTTIWTDKSVSDDVCFQNDYINHHSESAKEPEFNSKYTNASINCFSNDLSEPEPEAESPDNQVNYLSEDSEYDENSDDSGDDIIYTDDIVE